MSKGKIRKILNRVIPGFRIALLLPMVFAFQFLAAQSVYVKASINRDKILIGEPIALTLEASVPQSQSVTWFGLDSIPHFEFIERPAIDTVPDGSSFTYRQTISITSFDSGRWVIPALGLDVSGRTYLTDSLPVSVAFTNFDATQDYHDIKDILPVEILNQKTIVWTIAAVTLLALLVLIYLLRKPVAKSQIVQRKYSGKNLTAYDEAILALDELKAKRLPENGQVKSFYAGMEEILREFITRKTGNSVKVKTSSELGIYLKDINMPNDAFISLVQTFRMSDAVKFAKFVPGDVDNENSFSVFKKSIESLNTL